ncbi:MAG: lipoyl domain-containing protein [Candidatus Omnitrophota bacterium]|jgi:2-oxoglutarate dehydrogenase E2 component (dihydrolipoamide succinyltransferase)
MVKIILPQLSADIPKATVTYWYFKAGDAVTEKDDLVELTTDKATFNLPSPCSGILTEISALEGAVVNVGDSLGLIQES